MKSRSGFLRSAAIILCAAVLTSGFGACATTVVKPTGAAETEENTPVPSLMTASETFALAAKQALLTAVDRSERLSSARLDLLLSPAAQLDGSASNDTKATVTLTDPQDPDSNTTLSIESTLDTATGDASLVTSVQTGSEVAKSGGLYFTGDTMLIKRANVEKPMLLHSFDPAVAASYAGQAAPERFIRAFSDCSTPKMSDAEWGTAIDAYLQSVTALAQETNYVSEPQAVSVAGTTQDCTATTLSLSGENAVSTVQGIVTLISKDPIFKASFVSTYMIDGETYGVTGMDGVLRDLDALTPESRAALAVTFKTLSGDKVSAMYISAVSGNQSMSLLLKFFKNGYVREDDLVFTGFDGAGIKMTEQNISAGGDKYLGQLVYEDTAPGGVLNSHLELSLDSTITEQSVTTTTQLKLTRAATPDMDALDISATLSYAQQKTAQGNSGQASGSMTSVSEGETDTITIAMTLEQSDTAPAIMPPQFIPAAGISTTDQSGLYSVFGEDFEADQYQRAPASIKLLSTLMLLIL